MPNPKPRRPSSRRRKNLTADQVVADQVRWLRDQRGISQQKLADSLGWTQSQVARLELGRRAITIADLFALCWALDVAPVYLLAGSFTGNADVPVIEQLRLAPNDMKNWVCGNEPLPGSNYRRFAENIPDDEWLAAYGDVVQQRRDLAEHWQQIEAILAAGGTRRPGSTRPDTAELAAERERRRSQLEAAKRTRKSKSDRG